MDRWNDYAYPQIAAVAKQDKVFLNLLEENKMLELEYMKIMKSLGEDTREIIDRYIASCESIEYRFAQLAYWFGCFQNN